MSDERLTDSELNAIRERYRNFRGVWLNVNPDHIDALLTYIDALEAENARLRAGVHRFGTLLTEYRDEDGNITEICAPEAYLEPGMDGYDLALWMLQIEYDESEDD